MLLLDIFRYLKSRADKRPLSLKKFVDSSQHHGPRSTYPSVAIIIPTRDKFELLRACIESVEHKTKYQNFSIIVVDNQSTEPATLDYLRILEARGHSVLQYPHKFNYSDICNFAAATTDAEFLCFLNNDTEALEPDWLGLMIDHAKQPNVGVVGAKLLYPDGSIQHMGIALGYKGVAGHVDFESAPQTATCHNCFQVSAVTFGCAVVSAAAFKTVGGFDTNFKYGLNDVSLCAQMRRIGLIVVLCGSAELLHRESQTRPAANSPKGFFRAAWEVIYYLTNIEGFCEDEFFETLA